VEEKVNEVSKNNNIDVQRSPRTCFAANK
jgi:hypothetical protein